LWADLAQPNLGAVPLQTGKELRALTLITHLIELIESGASQKLLTRTRCYSINCKKLKALTMARFGKMTMLKMFNCNK
jgi:hypothetical protein